MDAALHAGDFRQPKGKPIVSLRNLNLYSSNETDIMRHNTGDCQDLTV